MIKANSLNSLVYQTCEKILKEGTPLHSRNGLCWELLDVDLYLANPKARYLYLNGRTNNPFATLFETIWVFAGLDSIQHLEVFIPRAKNYSDDGKTWRGAYGTRVYNHNQINSVLEHFLKEGFNTRRAVMTIWQPELDTQESIRKQGFQSSKDIPCSQWLGFWIRDNKLYLKFQMRSNDVIFGFSHINVFEFTTLQQIVKEMIENNSGEKLDLGYYHHSVVSLHLYDFSRKQAESIVGDKENLQFFLPKRTLDRLIPPYIYNQKELQIYFRQLYDYIVGEISYDFNKDLSCEIHIWAELSRIYFRYKTEGIEKSKFINTVRDFLYRTAKLNEDYEIVRSVEHYLNRISKQE